MLIWFGAGVPWDILRGEVNIDVLEGSTQIVVLKQPSADGLDYRGEAWIMDVISIARYAVMASHQ